MFSYKAVVFVSSSINVFDCSRVMYTQPQTGPGWRFAWSLKMLKQAGLDFNKMLRANTNAQVIMD